MCLSNKSDEIKRSWSSFKKNIYEHFILFIYLFIYLGTGAWMVYWLLVSAGVGVLSRRRWYKLSAVSRVPSL